MMNKVVLLILFHNYIRSLNRNFKKLETHLLEELVFHFHIVEVIPRQKSPMQINQ